MNRTEEIVTFDYNGEELTGTVISWYTVGSNKRVTVATENGAVYALRADSVRPVGGSDGS
jgi:hypothetical protein